MSFPAPAENREYPEEDAWAVQIHGVANVLAWQVIMPVTVTLATYVKVLRYRVKDNDGSFSADEKESTLKWAQTLMNAHKLANVVFLVLAAFGVVSLW